MTIDPDVRGIAAGFNLDAALVQAVCNAEGNIVRAVQCTYEHVTTREEAIRILCRSIVHAMRNFIVDNGYATDFVTEWGHTWAPPNAANDPQQLNRNWSRNVISLWARQT